MDEQQEKRDELKQSDSANEQESESQTKRRTVSRRQFLIISAITAGVAGTGLLIGFNVFERQGKAGKGSPASTGSFAPNVWVQIDADNTITIQVAKSEMGQGVLTALAMLVAEDMDADWARVRVEQAVVDTQYGDQKTDGSSSVSDSYLTMRGAGAGARAFFVAAAAQSWGVNQSTCRTEKSMVIHTPTGRRVPYGDLIGVASKLNPVTLYEVKAKPTEHLTLIGTRVPRVDTPAKINGSALFGLDIRLPGMHYATVARCPILGGSLEGFDSTTALEVPGVLQVFQIKTGIAVVAKNTWAAIQGRQALKVTWKPGPNAHLDSAQLRDELAAEVQKLSRGHTGADQTLNAVYETPFLAHATMEPMNCTAHMQANRCEVWAPTQHPEAARMVASTESGLPPEAVTLHVTFMGGGFGRRVETDFVAEAVQVSKATRAPVQVVWTREDDIQHDFYRPASYHQLSAGLTAHGLPHTWTHAIATQDTDRDDHGAQPPTDGADLPYSIATTHIIGSPVPSAVPAGIWRSSNYFNTIFAVESFLDEVAAAGGLDPYQLRLQLIGNDPRLQKVVQLAASKAGWGTPLPAGWGRGIALSVYFTTTAVAEVAEVSVGPDYSVRVHRIVCAVDCGLVVNPAIAEAQIEGAVVMGLTAALKGEITVANGEIQQSNFHNYPLLRMNEMPTIEVYFVPGTGSPTGLGEPGLPPVAPAVANAIYAATGKRIRRLPIRADDLR